MAFSCVHPAGLCSHILQENNSFGDLVSPDVCIPPLIVVQKGCINDRGSDRLSGNVLITYSDRPINRPDRGNQASVCIADICPLLCSILALKYRELGYKFVALHDIDP